MSYARGAGIFLAAGCGLAIVPGPGAAPGPSLALPLMAPSARHVRTGGAASGFPNIGPLFPDRHDPAILHFPVGPLAPDEEAIARRPFAPEAARSRLARAVYDVPGAHLVSARLKEDSIPASPRNDMGFRLPDRQYWRQIPAAARDIPYNWSGLPLVRFTNSEIGGIREVRLRRGREYDQWLLNDREHDLTACISVRRTDHRLYFMQFTRRRNGAWRLKVSDDNCFSCHPSGPRVIRPLGEPLVDRKMLSTFDRLILSYGACDFGDSLDPRALGSPVRSPGCVSCHNGHRRGRLYAANARTRLFKITDEQTMPP